MDNWTPAGWQLKSYFQEVNYIDQVSVQAVLEQLRALPGLVEVSKIKQLNEDLKHVQAGSAWVLHAGVCVEHFSQDAKTIDVQMKAIQQLGQQLEGLMGKPVVCIARIAGLFCKPRSTNREVIDGHSVMTYRGDMIHQHSKTPAGRAPDPQRMLDAYFHSARILSQVNRDFPDVYVSHEAIHLPFEQPFCRWESQGHALLSTHLPWIGIRHLQNSDAHIEFLKGVCNPIGLKVGAITNPIELVRVLSELNPQKIEGRIKLIHRFSKQDIQTCFQALMDVVEESEHPVLWVCDPMHGNHVYDDDGVKFRLMGDMLETLNHAKRIHESSNIPLSGVHLEVNASMRSIVKNDEDFLKLAVRTSNPGSAKYIDPELAPEQAQKLVEAWLKP